MTYGELVSALSKLSPEQLQTTVTVYVGGPDEFYPIDDVLPLCVAGDQLGDILDEGHPFLQVDVK